MRFVAQQVLKLRENTVEITAFHTCHVSQTPSSVFTLLDTGYREKWNFDLTK